VREIKKVSVFSDIDIEKELEAEDDVVNDGSPAVVDNDDEKIQAAP